MSSKRRWIAGSSNKTRSRSPLIKITRPLGGAEINAAISIRTDSAVFVIPTEVAESLSLDFALSRLIRDVSTPLDMTETVRSFTDEHLPRSTRSSHEREGTVRNHG